MSGQIRLPQYISPPPLHEAGVAKHPHLTPKQHEERRHTALHEAAHFVAGITGGAGYHDVYVRVPGRSPKSGLFSRGAAGGANVHGVTGEQETMIDIAAVLVELAINPESWMKRAASDFERAASWMDKNSSPQQATALFNRTLCIVADHWPAIDAAAAAFLELGHWDGVVPVHRCSQIVDYVRSNSWRDREPHYSIPIGFYVRLDAIRDTDLALAPFQTTSVPTRSRTPGLEKFGQCQGFK